MIAGELLGSFLGDWVDSPLARQTITAATIATFAEPFIYSRRLVAGVLKLLHPFFSQ
jgi:hypothetical protein